MRAAGKIALLVTCIAGLALGWFGWHMHQSKVRAAKRAVWLEPYQRRAEHGDPVAEAEMGYLYVNGKGVPLDYAKAFDWYSRSANQGSADGEGALGSMYYYGRGVPIDYAAAWNWYLKGAAQGNAYAENAVGTMLREGLGTTQNYAQARSWFQKAAEQHYPEAAYNLGTMYWYGYGVPKNRTEAYQWFRKAAANGDTDAQIFLSEGLSPTCKAILLVQFVGGLILVLGTLPIQTNYWNQRRLLNPGDRKIELATGIFCILAATYGWYGYEHHLMRRFGAGPNAFTIVRWVMDAVSIPLLLYILRLAKRQQDNDDQAVLP